MIVSMMSASLSDRLNPTHPAFDAELKACWATMPRKERAAAAKADLDALAARAAATPVLAAHPFPVDEDDHCETPAEAYADIAPVLHCLSATLGVKAADLQIWDPYYCNGAVKRHLADQGFHTVHNEPEDFYAIVREGRAPPFHVLLTNPAYSGEHIPRLLDICGKHGAPCLLLMPNYVAGKPYFSAAQKRWPASIGRTLFLVPPKRYSYWTPKGLRSKTQSHASAAGHRTSPFVSFWYVCLGVHEAAVLRSLRFGAENGTAAPAVGGAGAPSKPSSTPTACRLRMFRSVAALPKGVKPSVRDSSDSAGALPGSAVAAAAGSTAAAAATEPSKASTASAVGSAAFGRAVDASVTGIKRRFEPSAHAVPKVKRRRDAAEAEMAGRAASVPSASHALDSGKLESNKVPLEASAGDEASSSGALSQLREAKKDGGDKRHKDKKMKMEKKGKAGEASSEL